MQESSLEIVFGGFVIKTKLPSFPLSRWFWIGIFIYKWYFGSSSWSQNIDDWHLDALHDDNTIPWSDPSYHLRGFLATWLWSRKADQSGEGPTCCQVRGRSRRDAWIELGLRPYHHEIVRSVYFADQRPHLHNCLLGCRPHQIIFLWQLTGP